MKNSESLILDNLHVIKKRMAMACDKAGRDINEVKLMLATKTVPIEKIQTAINAENLLLGENKVIEALEKYEALDNNRLQWHIIGHLQTNKIKYLLKFAHVLQSVDRLKLVRKLQKRCEYDKRDLDIFIQVNTSFEDSKFGVPPGKAIEFIKKVSEFERLHIKGLMTIGILSSKDEKVRDCFKRLKEIQFQAKDLNLPGASFNELSMGMSNDLELAIEEGSTIIRVGTAIFGERPYPDSYYWNEN